MSYQQAVGDWLSGLADWDYWFTSTDKYQAMTPHPSRQISSGGKYRMDPGPGTGRSPESWRRAMGRLEGSLQPRAMFWGLEPHKSGLLHVHGLIQVDPDAMLPAEWSDIAQALRYFGRADVQRYDPELGAGHYVSKYVSKRLDHWDFRVGRPS